MDGRVTITRDYEFSAAHRIEGHPKCGRMHGHNYRVTVGITADSLMGGMILDYGEMDKVIKPIIEQFDHHYMVSNSNLEANDPYFAAAPVGDIAFTHTDASTAECLAERLCALISDAFLGTSNIDVLFVQVDETPKSSAFYQRGL